MFGDKLVNLRKKYKLTQEEVADKLGITRQTVSNWELNQTKPDLEQLKGVSKLYETSIDELVDNNFKKILTEKVSNVEKLAGLIYKLLLFFGIFISLLILLSILGLSFFNYYTKVETVKTVVTLNCTLNKKNHIIDITFDQNDEIVEVSGDVKIIAELKLNDYQYQYEAVEVITKHFEGNGGSC